ncbi:hypothetical protein E2K80_18225 [Rhodophyticola sp. CCM32]|nr:hypothetical protein [Rhodophyticola sp. CCM32]QBY02852.1 hypothetical protein E2K80_18225 [Rhodophyticola sp. CCM32]
MLGEWWVWMAGALVLAVGEVLLPSFILLGFAIGAGVVGLILLIGGPLALWLAGSMPVMMLVFAVMSLVAWLLLRHYIGLRRGPVKSFDHDINDN